MTQLRRILLAFSLPLAFLLTACSDYDIPVSRPPVMRMADATLVTRTSAVVHAYIQTDHPAQFYFEYGEETGPLTATAGLTPQGDSVHCALSDLTPGTPYLCRLCSHNGRVKTQSADIRFVTVPYDLPTVSSPTPIAHGPVSYILAYQILSDGGAPILRSGCRVKNLNSGETLTCLAESPAVEGEEQRVTIHSLERLTPYEFIPFAVNAEGESAGPSLCVTTDNSIHLADGGLLPSLMQDDHHDYAELTFSGCMQGDDFRCLRELSVTQLNLADVSIIPGGAAYIPSRYTQTDTVGYGLFSSMPVSRVVLPLTAVAVEEQAFKDCSLLTSVVMPAQATHILPSDGCTSLAEIEVPAANSSYCSIDGVLYDASVSRIVWMPLGKTTPYTLPSTITSIGAYAFRGCHFSSFVMGSQVTEMGQAAFYDSWVEQVTLSDALATVPTATFQQCARLAEVRLGSGTEQLGSYVFDGTCLAHLYVSAEYPPVCYSNTFATLDGYDLFARCTLHVPAATKSLYRNHPYWGKFSKIISLEQ